MLELPLPLPPVALAAPEPDPLVIEPPATEVIVLWPALAVLVESKVEVLFPPPIPIDPMPVAEAVELPVMVTVPLEEAPEEVAVEVRFSAAQIFGGIAAKAGGPVLAWLPWVPWYQGRENFTGEIRLTAGRILQAGRNKFL